MLDMEKSASQQRRRDKRLDDKEVDRMSTTPLLDHEARLKYRSGTMWTAYLPLDRPDISETAKMLSQAMSKPREGHVGWLNILVRYLAAAKRVVIVHGRQHALRTAGNVG